MTKKTANYLVKLKDRHEVAERTMAFQIEKPTNFTFKPGQWIDITLLDPPETDAEGNVRGFSIASAPHEDTLTVATRLRGSAFKRVLTEMPLGTEIEITPPGGGFFLHNNPERTAVFLSGGIGVTPLRSMLRHATHEKLPHKIVFFFSNRRPEDAPFLKELDELQKENPNYRFIPTMSKMENSSRSWSGETGWIDKKMLDRYLRDAQSPIYYIVGPQAMVDGLQQMLNDSGVDDDDIRLEGFSGY